MTGPIEENSGERNGSGLLPVPEGESKPAGETKESPALAEQQINTEPKRFRKTPLPMLIAAAISVLLLGCVAFVVYLYFGMKPVLTHEYGYPLPDASVFSPDRTCFYGYVPEDVDKKGLHRLTVTTDRGVCPVWILIRDTVAPAASARPRTISTRVRLGPDELIEDLQDKDIVKVSFLETPPFGMAGDYEPVIILEDQSGNSRTVVSELHVRVTKESVTVEAGSEPPAAERFLIDDYAVEGITEITERMLRTPGEYPVSVTVDGIGYESVLKVVDTVPPAASSGMLIRLPGETVEPMEFLTGIQDETEVTATYVLAPDPENRGVQQVVIRLTDLGGNYTDLSASLLLTHAEPVTVEARMQPLRPEECMPPERTEQAVFRETFIPDTVGTYSLDLIVNGTDELALVEVRDTVAPVISAGAYSWYTNHPVALSELCTELSDVTDITVSCEPEIDWSMEGTQEINLTATDEGGNHSCAKLLLTLVHDTEKPVLYGVVNRNSYAGEPVAYFSEVFAEDNLDEHLQIEVDNSEVNINKAGTYRVTYYVTDTDGNSATASCTLKIVAASVTDETVQELARSVLGEILTTEMTKTEQLEAVFNYVRGHVRYVGTSDKNDWRKEAERGFRTGRGDCFTFYSVTRALLDQLDIEYMSVTRKGGRTRHYWVIVNVGTGWYHFDPTIAPQHKHRCFMWTNKQCKVKPYFWRFEESKYPQIADAPFDKNAVIAAEREQMQTGR